MYLGEAYQFCATTEGGQIECYATRHQVSETLPQNADFQSMMDAAETAVSVAPVAPLPVAPTPAPAPTVQTAAPVSAPAPVAQSPAPAPASASPLQPTPATSGGSVSPVYVTAPNLIPTFTDDPGALAPTGSGAVAASGENGSNAGRLILGALALLSLLS